MSLSSEEEEDQFLSDGEDENDDDLPSDLDDDLDNEEEPFGPAQPPPTQSQMLSFGPPYYGRPPTPLPPSPSLTSLLRPSRPTTPDASDDEGLNSAEPVPRASPKVPTYEYYGFVLYLFSSLVFLIYLLWSYLPSPFLHVLGIYYYPNRWWSLAIPSFLVMLLVYIYVALALYNTEYLTLPLNSLETIVDDAGKIAVVDGRGRIVTSEERRRNLEREREREELRGIRGNHHHHHQRKSSGNGYGFFRERGVDWGECWNEGTDAVMDVPLAGVCEVLYGGANPEDGDVSCVG
ncbi:Meiotically up-regulated gene 84 protein [Cytospora mali]|uniref:Meiotically up-regulated gene 84 protein n=1 Tax=Cytospora mali TaxID=578113 RepID=A0A194V404_CYTMA|nr:Meiotically up-regulated gene 84 protein [Valsa mali var. pyri (nom. inval.)]